MPRLPDFPLAAIKRRRQERMHVPLCRSQNQPLELDRVKRGNAVPRHERVQGRLVITAGSKRIFKHRAQPTVRLPQRRAFGQWKTIGLEHGSRRYRDSPATFPKPLQLIQHARTARRARLWRRESSGENW